jgi:putative heme-binding domain-containing protein
VKLASLLKDAAKELLQGTESEVALGVALVGAFQITALEADLVEMARSAGRHAVAALQALHEIRSTAVDLFVGLAKSSDSQIQTEALAALAVSRHADAPAKLLALLPSLTSAQQRTALNALSATEAGARAIVSAISGGSLKPSYVDSAAAERLSLVLKDDPALSEVMSRLGHVFHEVLAFDGTDDAWVESGITLDGPFTVEAWVKLDAGMDNNDSLLGVPDGLQLNFFQSKFRVYAGAELRDVAVSAKPMTADLWTHLAVTRDGKGEIRIYQNGELDAVSRVPAPIRWENCRIGWSGPAKGTKGIMAEFRVWKHERTPAEIRSNFDRTLESAGSYPRAENKLHKGASLVRTTDYPPILTPEQAATLDQKFARLSKLGHTAGNREMGKVLSAICTTCHQIGGAGGQIGPDLSGAGAMGLEAVLRNILTPNAAMEPGYRIYRVELKNGELVDAFLVSEEPRALVVRQPGLPDRRIPRVDVSRASFIRRSLMPEGLLDGLSDAQAADLLSYLMSLK